MVILFWPPSIYYGYFILHFPTGRTLSPLPRPSVTHTLVYGSVPRNVDREWLLSHRTYTPSATQPSIPSLRSEDGSVSHIVDWKRLHHSLWTETDSFPHSIHSLHHRTLRHPLWTDNSRFSIPPSPTWMLIIIIIIINNNNDDYFDYPLVAPLLKTFFIFKGCWGAVCNMYLRGSLHLVLSPYVLPLWSDDKWTALNTSLHAGIKMRLDRPLGSHFPADKQMPHAHHVKSGEKCNW